MNRESIHYKIQECNKLKLYLFSIVVFLTFLSSACLKQFIPETAESKNLLVIEGLITDQNEAYKVKLSRSQSLGLKFEILPVTGANVTVSDDLGNYFTFAEKDSGVYLSLILQSSGAKQAGNTCFILGLQTVMVSAPIMNLYLWR